MVFQSNLSECGSHCFYLFQLCSVPLSTSGDLPSLNLCGSTSDPPRMFKLLQKTELLDLFIQLPKLRRDTLCLQPRPATRWLLWLVCINKKGKTITTNSFINLTGHKTERDCGVSAVSFSLSGSINVEICEAFIKTGIFDVRSCALIRIN